MNRKELQKAILNDERDMKLLTDYIQWDMLNDPFDSDLMEGLNYFFYNRDLEIQVKDELNVMNLIDDSFKEELDKDEHKDPDWEYNLCYELARKIVQMTVEIWTVIEADGTIRNLNEENGTERRKTEKISYAELSRRVGDSILCNAMENRLWVTMEIQYGDMDHKDDFGRETDMVDIYQWYIISDDWAHYLGRNTDQLVFYDEELDVYVWWITHYWTSWDSVYTTVYE